MKKSVSILVVDDDSGMLKTLHYILADKGYEVVTLSSGAEAVELIKKKFFDIVLTDIRMPGMNGVEVLKEIKRLSPGTSVMMITAYTMHELVQEAKNGGAKAVFPKPLDWEKIIPKIEEFSNKRPIQGQDIDLEHSELLRILENREREIKEKSLLIDELKRELAKIKINPSEMLDEARRKKQSENVHAVLKQKQYELFKILSQGEKGYEEILETVQSKNLDIRDMAALRLQISRLDKKLKQDTIYKIERIRRNKALYFRIDKTIVNES